MLTADQILARHRESTSRSDYCPDPYRPHRDGAFDVKQKYRKPVKPSDEFDVKEERERWGCVLPTSRGFSGVESGTKSVIRSMNDDRRLSVLDVRIKKRANRDRLFHDFFVSNVMPRLMWRLNVRGDNPDYEHKNVPQPCIDTREAAWLEQIAYHSYWVTDDIKDLIVAALRFTVRYGRINTDDLLSLNRCVKNRLIHAYHMAFGAQKSDADAWWRSILDERRSRGESFNPPRDPERPRNPVQWGNMTKENQMEPPFDGVQYTPEEMRQQADYLQDVKLSKEAVMLRQAACYVEKYGPWKEGA